MKKLYILLSLLQAVSVCAQKDEIIMHPAVSVSIVAADMTLTGYLLNRVLLKRLSVAPRPARIAGAVFAAGLSAFEARNVYKDVDLQTSKTTIQKVKCISHTMASVAIEKVKIAAIPTAIMAFPNFLWLPAATLGGMTRTAKVVWTNICPWIFKNVYLGLSYLTIVGPENFVIK